MSINILHFKQNKAKNACAIANPVTQSMDQNRSQKVPCAVIPQTDFEVSWLTKNVAS
jgi:hypothetical protein